MFRRTRTWAHFALILIVLFSLSVVLAQDTKSEAVGLRPDAPTYAVHGPYAVGTRDMEIPAQDTKPALKLVLWYPALNPNKEEEKFTYKLNMKYEPPLEGDMVVHGHALFEAAPDVSRAPYPVVILSHGFATAAGYYSYLGEHLASYGFMVMAPEHLEKYYFNDTPWQDMPASSIDRPQDTIRVLDYAEFLNQNSDLFKGFIDVKQAAVAGHSYGGYTALAAAGARYDLKPYNERCAALSEDDPNQFLCEPFVPYEQDMATRAGLPSLPDGMWPSWGDARVRAIVTLAGDSYLFDKAGLAEIKIPVLALGGTLDDSTPYEWGVRPTYDNISSQQKALVTFNYGNHYMFLSTCENAPWLQPLGFYFFCSDSVWDLSRVHDLTNHFATAFLLDTLKADKDAHTALAPDAVKFPGITYESQGF